ncbi:hypothetical protein BKA64DRAFT_646002 [Cadophora sp. MPI-SDFR-AT-0126]|nr:hypothetical protein BKA64DRAFT_646002 [Leotiomycetes sp. MPI-SDFR-AT-0126]
MANLDSSFSPLEDEDRSSFSTFLGGGDLEKDQNEYLYTNLRHKLPKTFNTMYKCLITFSILLPWVLLALLYKIEQNGGAKVLPKLPTHDITSSAIEYQLKILDDEFYTTEPENLKYKGIPRKELDDAWNALIENMHMRVHPDEAKAAGFDSVEVADGSGDVYALPVVFHNLHCLMSNLYGMRGLIIPRHSIRQALMCQGDMSLYYFYWPESEGRNKRPFPRHIGHKEHVCVNWDRLQAVAHERRFSLLGEKKMLINPFFPEASLENKIVPPRKNYSVYDGLDIQGPQLFEGLEDIEELKHVQNRPGSLD